MKILLFAPPFEAPSKEATSYPLGLAYLGAVLEKEGHNVMAYDFLFEHWLEVKDKIKKIITDSRPDIVGISLMTTNRYAGYELSKMCKEINPKIKVIMGGVHPSLMYEQLLKNFPVDFIVLGEGEETVVELLANLNKKSKLK